MAPHGNLLWGWFSIFHVISFLGLLTTGERDSVGKSQNRTPLIVYPIGLFQKTLNIF
jgi:hypothetical protein